MRIIPLTYELCNIYQSKLSDYIYQSVRNSHYVDSFAQKDAESKCLELKEYLRNNKAVCYGAINDEDLVGFIWAYEFPFRDDKKRLYISIIHVDAGYRGHHIGSQLIKEVQEYAERNNYNALFLHTEAHNTNAQGFYKSIGFELERLQLVKKVEASQNKWGVKRLDAFFLKEHIDKFSELFLQNLKAHTFVESFDYQYAYMKMDALCNYLSEGKAYCFYIEENNQIYGFIWGYKYPYKGKDRMLIAAIQISEDCRSKGYGMQLIESLQDIARKNNLHYVYTHTDAINKRAQKFYHNLGFVDEEYQFVLFKKIG